MAQALKNLRESFRAIKRNEMPTKNLCESFCAIKRNEMPTNKNISRMYARRCPSVLKTKEKSVRFAGASINFCCHATNSHGAKHFLLPHIFAVFGVVCGGNTAWNLSPNMCPNISKNSF